ncbi:hypothetical protein BLOT_003015 [Blomia tropicalis]|nr:hypothetical protein BLOT_003015 [Blomia tropicalis]
MPSGVSSPIGNWFVHKDGRQMEKDTHDVKTKLIKFQLNENRSGLGSCGDANSATDATSDSTHRPMRSIYRKMDNCRHTYTLDPIQTVSKIGSMLTQSCVLTVECYNMNEQTNKQ